MINTISKISLVDNLLEKLHSKSFDHEDVLRYKDECGNHKGLNVLIKDLEQLAMSKDKLNYREESALGFIERKIKEKEKNKRRDKN
jgi:hypothetical protein